MNQSKLTFITVRNHIVKLIQRVKSNSTWIKQPLRISIREMFSLTLWRNRSQDLRLWLAFLLILGGGLLSLNTTLALYEKSSGSPVQVKLEVARPASSFRLKAEPLQIAIGETGKVTLSLDTGGAVIDRFTAVIVTPVNHLTLGEVSFSPGSCAEPGKLETNSSSGIITLTCTSLNRSETKQIIDIASFSVTPLAGPAPVIGFDRGASEIIASDGREVLQNFNPLIISPATPLAANLSQYPLAAARGSDRFGCLTSLGTHLDWLQPEGITKFLYSFTEGTPNLNPDTPSTSRATDLPLKLGTTHFFTLRGLTAKGVAGPVTVTRVVSCP